MFVKYPSVENTYRHKEIAWWLEQFPELNSATYVLQEKLHGANFQIIIGPNDSFQIGKRSGLIEKGESFYGAQLVTNELASYGVFDLIKAEANDLDLTFTLHGELFGGKIQKGVDYGPDKKFRIFDVRINGVLVPPVQMFDMATRWELVEFLVPGIAIVEGLKDALEHTNDFNSRILNIPNNCAEGYVAKPLNKVYRASNGSTFFLKNKNDKWKEKAAKSKRPRLDKKVSIEAAMLKADFDAYLVEERVQGIFSKHGEIERPDQMGAYIKLVLEDAKADFVKDCSADFDTLGANEQKYVLNGAKVVAGLLKVHL